MRLVWKSGQRGGDCVLILGSRRSWGYGDLGGRWTHRNAKSCEIGGFMGVTSGRES